MLLDLPVNLDHAKYTLPSHPPPVRSTSIAVLSLNFPFRSGADEPRATISERTNSFPSFAVAPASPCGFRYVATHTSPNVFLLPAGSSELSDPANSRPWLSHASIGSPALAVRMCARAAYGLVSPGYPGTKELVKRAPPLVER